MRHYILAKFQGRCRGLARLPPADPRDLRRGGGDSRGVRGAAVYPGCVDRENRYHVLIELEMEPSALTTYDESAMHHRWKDEFGRCWRKRQFLTMKDKESGYPLSFILTEWEYAGDWRWSWAVRRQTHRFKHQFPVRGNRHIHRRKIKNLLLTSLLGGAILRV